MASRSLSGLTGTWENHQQGSDNSIKPGDSPVKEGYMAHYDGPTEHVDILEFYYGNPTSTSKSHGTPSHSRW